MENKSVRLDKFLSHAGISSRRAIKKVLKEENLTINGQRVTESGIRVNPAIDKMLLNGKTITEPAFVYFLLNKPIGYISTTADEFARDNVVSLIDTPFRVYPVGRLDKDTHGLLILTNDGALTHKVTHPRYHVPKVYRLLINGKVSEQQIATFKTGVLLSDGITLPAEVQPLSFKDNKTTLLVTLHEGRNRQIRRMCETLEMHLLDLERIAFGPIKLGKLETGSYRALSKREVEALRKAVENS